MLLGRDWLLDPLLRPIWMRMEEGIDFHLRDSISDFFFPSSFFHDNNDLLNVAKPVSSSLVFIFYLARLIIRSPSIPLLHEKFS